MGRVSSRLLLLFWVVAFSFCSVGAFIVNPGPKFPPTRGHPWPLPKKWTRDDSYFFVDANKLKISLVDGNECLILRDAMQRYSAIIQEMAVQAQNDVTPAENDVNHQGTVAALEVTLENTCEEYPHLGMDESYSLEIQERSSLKAPHIWGLLRGLETFSQLIHPTLDHQRLRINASRIEDSPHYPHRGLLVDTSRHFVSPETLKTILDGMAYNKLNVFHWHLVDDQSFPFVSAIYPELSERGAYKPSYTYSPDTVQEIIEYARRRGVRVVPEFDTPGHTRSWGNSHLELLTACHGQHEGQYGPMDPTKNETYRFLRNLFREVKAVFPEQFFHLGADEVDFDCWSSNAEVVAYMKKQGYGKDYAKLQSEFVGRVVATVQDMQGVPVVWEEAFSPALAPEAVVHVWKRTEPMAVMERVVKAGFRGILSTGWYLDRVQFAPDTVDYLKVDPRGFQGTAEEKARVLGGEACMWSELVDDDNILQRIFSRVAATAERLWVEKVQDLDYAQRRIEEHNCRLRQRHIKTQPPNGPGFC